MKGGKPTPRTIYPALKQLKNNGMIVPHKEGRKIIYSLTDAGQKTSQEAVDYFCSALYPIFTEYMLLDTTN